MDAPKRKLSPSAINLFLRSPKSYYWRYIARLEPATQSVATFEHDRIMGTLWSDFVDRFYKHVPEATNTTQMLQDWDEQTLGWVPEKTRLKYRDILESWANTYHQSFEPTDGCRNGSEKLVENDRFMGYVDGLSHDLILHEVKSTSRSPQLLEQLGKVQTSLQVKLYCVLTGAVGIRIEFAWKDSPYAIYRSDVLPVTKEQRDQWEQELNVLADYIHSLGDDPHNYICHPDGCTIISKNFVGHCPYQALCLGLEGAEACFMTKTNRRESITKQ